jgi:hypothetical protein
MNRFRSHIAQWLVALLVVSGFSLSFVHPAQARPNSYAFAQWLDMMTKSSDGNVLQKQLQDLRTSGDALSEMIQEASKIVSKNNKEFNFSFDEDASGQMYQLLLIEWNQFQTGDAMATIPSPQKTIKPLLPWHTDKLSAPAVLQISVEQDPIADKQLVVSKSQQRSSPIALQPMSSGIAIGAP